MEGNALKRSLQDCTANAGSSKKLPKFENSVIKIKPPRTKKGPSKKSQELETAFQTKLQRLKDNLKDTNLSIHKLFESLTSFQLELKECNNAFKMYHSNTKKTNSLDNLKNKWKSEMTKIKELTLRSFREIKKNISEISNNDAPINTQIKNLKLLTTSVIKLDTLISTTQNKIAKPRDWVKDKTAVLKKPRKSVKRQTVTGDEFQILLRQRGLETSNFELGVEVSGVGQLDDMVYVKKEKNLFRFFQVKHSSENKLVTTKELFKSPNQNLSQKSYLHLLLYFESFCQIKDNQTYKDAEIEEITFITNMGIKFSSPKDSSLLIQKRNLDNFLSLNGGTARKYGLNVEKVKSEFGDKLKEGYWGMTDQLIHEFFEKTCIIVNYPDLEDLKRLTFHEVFKENIFHFKNNDLLQNCMSHIEITLLRQKDEFVSNEKWELKIVQLKKFVSGLKSTSITDFKTESDKSKVGYISFDHHHVRDMCEDIRKLLINDEHSILNCVVQNLKLNAVKVLHILHQLEKEKESFLGQCKFFYCDFEDLLVASCLIESFESGPFGLLVVTCVNDDENVQEVISKLENVLKNPKKKVILMTTFESQFVTEIKALTKEKYSMKEYEHGYQYLSPTSKEAIMRKKITFQDHKMDLGTLLNFNEDFANKAIDENSLWEILDKRNKTIVLSNTDAFFSAGYDEKYYITRCFYQKCVSYKILKKYLHKQLFLIMGMCGVEDSSVENALIQNGVNKEYIRKWDDHGMYKNANGIVLVGSQESSNLTLFNKMSKTGKIIHWLFMSKSKQLFFVDSNKVSDNKIVSITRHLKETDLHDPENDEKIIILVGGSGVGKSTVLTSIANKIREMHKNVWIAKVDLRRFFKKKTSKSLGDLNLINSAVETVTNMVFANDAINLFGKKLFKEGLDKTQKDNFRFVLLLDGYNEIKESFQINVCRLIKTLKNNCNIKQIWVTTQIQEKVKLESELGVPAYFLSSLKEKEQVELMARYWATEYSKKNPAEEHDYTKFLYDADIVIKKWKESISDEEKPFTEVSLNLIMLADVLQSDRKIDKNVDFLNLYDLFVEHKLTVYSKQPAHDPKERFFRWSICEILQQFSVEIILTKYGQYGTKSIKRLPRMNCYEQFIMCVGLESATSTLTKIGILTMRKGVLDFSHYSFAQFFFSKYLINNLNESKVQIFLMKHVLTQSSLQLCRKFLNRSLFNLIVKSLQGVSSAMPDPNISELNLSRIVFKDQAKQVLVKKTENVSIPVKEKLNYVVNLLLSKLDQKRYRSYLENIVKNDFEFDNISQENPDTFISDLQNQPREQVPNMLLQLKHKTIGCTSRTNNSTK